MLDDINLQGKTTKTHLNFQCGSWKTWKHPWPLTSDSWQTKSYNWYPSPVHLGNIPWGTILFSTCFKRLSHRIRASFSIIKSLQYQGSIVKISFKDRNPAASNRCALKPYRQEILWRFCFCVFSSSVHRSLSSTCPQHAEQQSNPASTPRELAAPTPVTTPRPAPAAGPRGVTLVFSNKKGHLKTWRFYIIFFLWEIKTHFVVVSEDSSR